MRGFLLAAAVLAAIHSLDRVNIRPSNEVVFVSQVSCALAPATHSWRAFHLCNGVGFHPAGSLWSPAAQDEAAGFAVTACVQSKAVQ